MYLLRAWIPYSTQPDSSISLTDLDAAESAYKRMLTLVPESVTVQLRDEETGAVLAERQGVMEVK